MGDVTPAQAKRIREAFDLFDTDQDGLLSPEEGEQALRSLAYLVKTCPTRPEITAVLEDIEAAEWTVDELEEAFTMLIEDDRFTVNPFAFLDKDGDGFVEIPLLRAALADMGEPCTDEQFKQFLKFAPVEDGKVDHRRFYENLVDVCMDVQP